MAPSSPSPSRRLVAGVHGAIFVGAATQVGITPLLPHIAERFGLSATAIALLVAAPGLAILAIGIPVGLLTDRLGARRLTLAAVALMCVASLGQALPAYPAILVARLAFGVAFGTILTAGVAWLSQAGSTRLGATVTSGSVGVVLGPGIGGLLGQGAGLAAPFLLSAAAAGAVALWLAACPAELHAPAPREGSGASLRELAAAARVPAVLAGAGGLAISGAVAGTAQLLAPLELHRSGASTGTIGLIYSAVAVLYIATSAIVVSAGARAVSLRVNAIAALAIGLALSPAMVSTSAVAVICALVATTIPRSVVGTLSYPLATLPGERTAVARGVAIGFVNAAWAAGLVIAPLIAGAVSSASGPRTAFLAIGVLSACAALALRARVPVERGEPPAERGEQREQAHEALA
jgi:predicted MFS family arabinose efflux permease